ncbi:MAG: sodium:calcium antiporter [Elusimicrobia bacterium]|nr:sodium:calcium antiporter [Elusimicrobiota bacterium]
MRRIVFFSSLCVPQIAVKLAALASGHHIENPVWSTLLAGLAVISAATLLAWASELAEQDFSQGLALAFVALVAVLPEYAVDLYFAWNAGGDLSYAPYAVANMTGANRMLIGVGWSAISIIYYLRSGNKSFTVDAGQVSAIWALIIATTISFVIPIFGHVGLGVGLLLVVLFGFYMRAAAGQHSEEKLAEPFIENLMSRYSRPQLKRLYRALFIFSALTILASAESFAEGLLALGKQFGVEEFLLVQWLAPLASEAPELLVALMFAWRLHPRAGLGTLISSKVNQWTLLVGMIPMVYGLSVWWHGDAVAHSPWAMPLDARQSEELFLTSAQSLFATILFCNFNFSLLEASLLFGLFALQLAFPGQTIRLIFGFLYLALAFGWLIWDRRARRNLWKILFERATPKNHEEHRE